jgi:hypothetical protein
LEAYIFTLSKQEETISINGFSGKHNAAILSNFVASMYSAKYSNENCNWLVVD